MPGDAMSAALPVVDCDGCTGDRCPGGCPILEGERASAEAERVETLRKALAALPERSAQLVELEARLASLRFVHSETCEAFEALCNALGVDTAEDALARVRELQAAEKQRTRRETAGASGPSGV
jgi:hypothetical protein